MAEKRQIQVHLVTRDEELKVPESAFYVPVTLRRYGLSEIVNQLLDRGDEAKPIPFDFLIDGELLKRDLDDYLTSKGLSTETTLTIEYTRSILPPSFLASFAHEDWVSAVEVSRGPSNPIASGSYDGIVRLWNKSGEVTDQLVGHNGAVKAVGWIDGQKRLVSAGADRNLCLWKTDDKKNTINALLTGHTASVDDVTVRGSNIVSASADKTLKVWSSDYKKLPEVGEEDELRSTASKKRRKLASAQLPAARKRTALATLSGHSSPVTGVHFHPEDDNVVYSCSEDHTVRTWDLTTGAQVQSRATTFPLLSITTLNEKGLIAVGSSARHITLIDPRDKYTNQSTQLFGHSNFVVALAPSPENSYMLLSGSHDGTSRIWDIRANKSIYSISRNSGETPTSVYDVDWQSDVGVVSVGKDKKLQINEAGFAKAS